MADSPSPVPREGRERLIERLTFSAQVRSTTATINRLCSKPFDRMHFFLDGHVSGIKNLVYDKAIDMALLYGAICSGVREERLVALARLRDEAYNFQGLEMPYNTRRILIALMKETVKAKGELQKQYRYMAAFRQALSGRAYVVRTMLDELGLAEVPETPGAHIDGWDDHVYDNAGPGRKTPAQLVLDAYIKGLSRLTIVYEDFFELSALEEAVEAGRLMGIQVCLGLECLVQTKAKQRFYHVLLFGGCATPRSLSELLAAPSVKSLLRLVHGNYAEYDRLYTELIQQFNKHSLPVINAGFEGTPGEMKRLSVEGLRAQAKGKYLFHAHLGQLLHRRLAKLREERRLLRPDAPGAETLKAAQLRKRFFDPLYKDILAEGDFVKADRLYAAVADVEAELGVRRITVAYIRPLDDELAVCVRQLLGGAAGIDEIELWSNRARQPGYEGDVAFLEALRRARNLDRVVMDHAVLPALAGNGIIRDCAAAHRYRLPVFLPEAEVAAVEQDIQLCRETGARIHIQHISCAAAVAAIRAARQAGLLVSGEASPHHIAIAAEDLVADDGNFRMNPPLGSREDLRALREAVLDGTLTAFATDHAPHAPETKSRGFLQATSGVIGLETAAAVTYSLMVGVEQMPLADWVARWTIGPAAILGRPLPTLAEGRPASLTLFDIDIPWRVDPACFQSRSRNCPFAGWTLHGQARLTVCEGRVTWSVISNQ